MALIRKTLNKIHFKVTTPQETVHLREIMQEYLEKFNQLTTIIIIDLKVRKGNNQLKIRDL